MPQPALADSVRLAWPGEAPSISAVQRRGWLALPDPVSQTLLAEVDESGNIVLIRLAPARG